MRDRAGEHRDEDAPWSRRLICLLRLQPWQRMGLLLVTMPAIVYALIGEDSWAEAFAVTLLLVPIILGGFHVTNRLLKEVGLPKPEAHGVLSAVREGQAVTRLDHAEAAHRVATWFQRPWALRQLLPYAALLALFVTSLVLQALEPADESNGGWVQVLVGITFVTWLALTDRHRARQVAERAAHAAEVSSRRARAARSFPSPPPPRPPDVGLRS